MGHVQEQQPTDKFPDEAGHRTVEEADEAALGYSIGDLTTAEQERLLGLSDEDREAELEKIQAEREERQAEAQKEAEAEAKAAAKAQKEQEKEAS